MRGYCVEESSEIGPPRALTRPLRGHPLPTGEGLARTLLSLVFVLAAILPARAEETVDLELVLAIDASASVDDVEWALQMDGYASAFRDPRVQAALRSGPNGRVAVAVLIWADATVPRWESGWFVLSSPQDGELFAAFMAGAPRIPRGGTGIGAGLAAAIRKLDRNGYDAPRQVVDVSGDGRETPPRETVVLIPMARAMAVARGVTVNGLVIVNEEPKLATWYRDNVIAGQGSFVMTAAGYDDFAEAIVAKLIREIEHQERLTQRLRRRRAQRQRPRSGPRSPVRGGCVATGTPAEHVPEDGLNKIGSAPHSP